MRWAGAAALMFAPSHDLSAGQAAPTPSPAAPLFAPVVVNVDYTRPVPDVHPMVGFLHAAAPTPPGDDRLLPLRPALCRIGYEWMCNRGRLAKLDIPTMLILGDSWGSPEVASTDKWGASTRTMVEKAAGRAFTWDVINEPDLSPSKAILQQYSELSAHSSHIIHRLLGSRASVSGPRLLLKPAVPHALPRLPPRPRCPHGHPLLARIGQRLGCPCRHGSPA